jgi:hypothetical protein
MAALRSLLAVALAIFALGLAPAPAAAQNGSDSAIIEDESSIVDPSATVAGTPTPTPDPSDSPTPEPTGTPLPGQTPTPVPDATRRDYIEPGYGSAAQQSPAAKRQERRVVCDAANRPPTSHMLGSIGVVRGNPSATWVPLVIAIAAGAAVFALVAFGLRKRGGDAARRPGALEGIATLVAICGGLAGLAAQFIPGAAVRDRPAKDVTMTVRDVKPRITRAEYARKIGLDVRDIPTEDRTEVGNVIWLQITSTGFKGEPLRVQYGLYDVESSEVLLPGTDRQVRLRAPASDVQTIFLPVWVGYPKIARFTAEFRLVDRQGSVQELATTGRMRGSRFRYACES